MDRKIQKQAEQANLQHDETNAWASHQADIELANNGDVEAAKRVTRNYTEPNPPLESALQKIADTLSKA